MAKCIAESLLSTELELDDLDCRLRFKIIISPSKIHFMVGYWLLQWDFVWKIIWSWRQYIMVIE